jgi:deoxyribonuclease-4
LIEISAGASGNIGSTFEELSQLVHHPKLKKYNVGICYDTQHGFSAGYDIRTSKTLDQTLKKFDDLVGLEKLKIFHCNDSKIELSGHKDRHDHIGDGLIGRAGFEAMIKNKKLKNINYYLETEHDKVVQDLNILKDIRG